MSDVTLKNYANRLGVDDPDTIRRATEFYSLIGLKASKIITNQAAKCVLAIECASIKCGTGVDRQQAISLSGLKSANEYKRQKDLIEKLLDLNKPLTLDEICAQLEISERSKTDARHLFNEYKAKSSFYDDTNSAPILAMAIYQSVKLRKGKGLTALKSNLMQLSKLAPKAWKQLEADWDNWIEKCAPLQTAAATAGQKKQTDKSNYDRDEPMDTAPDEPNDGDQQTPVEPYEEWRARMIAKATEIIKAATAH